jgi:5-dehydro-4-deoxyglucarate dehydratase
MSMHPQELKTVMGSGLLSFPLTDFDAEGNFNRKGYVQRLEWLAPYGASALFAAGGTGEFFSLTGEEVNAVVKTAVDTCRGVVPIIAGAGGPTRFAIQCAQAAEQAGAHGILLLPHYLTEAGPEGIAAHVEAVCRSVDFGVIFYNRGNSRLKPDALARLAERCPNLVGFKDGVGDIEAMVAIHQKLGDRFAYLGGLPTAEVYAAAYKAMGTPVYSSAVFNFIPKTAVAFYRAVAADDLATQHRLLKTFFMPYLELRNRVPGYAVSIVKAGARIVGHDAGPVRAPLTDLKPDEVQALAALIDQLGPQGV